MAFPVIRQPHGSRNECAKFSTTGRIFPGMSNSHPSASLMSLMSRRRRELGIGVRLRCCAVVLVAAVKVHKVRKAGVSVLLDFTTEMAV